MYTEPTTIDFLRPNGFVFRVDQLPNTNFSCQAVMLPGVNLGVASQETPLIDLPHPGDKLNFSALSVRFIITEDMSNYTELFTWLFGLGFPDTQDDYNNLLRSRSNNRMVGTRNELERSDGSLFILSSNNRPIKTINFTGLFPVALNMDEFDLTTTTVEYMTATATFSFQKFEFK